MKSMEKELNFKNFKFFIKKAKELHDEKYNYSKVYYINNRTKMIIIYEIHGEFLQTPSNHLLNRGCLECGKLKIKNRKSNYDE